jgi:hypothetical protein
MKSGHLYDREALERFIAASRRDTFDFGDQWARMLSLEWTLSRLDRAAAH